MTEHEKFVEDNGLPNCDFKLYHEKQKNVRLAARFRGAVKRLMRILQSCKSSIFTDILRNIQEQMQEERREKEKKQWKKALNSKPQTHEQRVEHLLTVLTTQVSTLTEKVNYLQEREAQCT
mmetsp:Transcript_2033/g.1923  ORF Transcript_2033/g.1923 Transcript_2033/m.1923 type:complete len:121 (+) Transcript_2033:201-563(+)